MNFGLIIAGGIGTRMRNAGVPKQYLKVSGKPIIVYTLERFENNKDIDAIVIVAVKKFWQQILTWTEVYHVDKFIKIVPAGASRQESILNGLESCADFSVDENDNVVIHDAVRPLVSDVLISACLEKLKDYQGCMPVLPLNDTVYQSRDKTTISSLLDRDTLFAGQAPEAFRLKEYLEINRNASKEELSSTRGSSEIAYKNGLKVCLIPGEDMNFKLTTPADLERFKVIVEESR